MRPSCLRRGICPRAWLSGNAGLCRDRIHLFVCAAARQALRYAGTAESSSAKAALSRSSSGVSWWPVCPPAICALRRRRAFCGAIRYTFPQAASAEAICPCWSIKKGKSGQWSACCPTSARRTVRCACLHAKKPGAVSLAARHAARSFFGAVRRGLLRNAADSAHAFRTGGACPRWAAGFVGGFFREGLHKNANRTLSVCYTRFLPGMRFVCSRRIFPYTLLENPFSVSGGRSTCGCTCPAGCSTACAAYCNIWRGNPVHAVSGVTVLFRRC